MGVVPIVAGLLFLAVLIYKPEFIAVLLFTLIIANINMDVKPLPLNLRAIISIALLGRILFDKNKPGYPRFISEGYTVYLVVFIGYSLLVSYAYGLFNFDLLKTMCMSFIAAICGFHFFLKRGDYKYLKISVVLAGLICLADLVYTFKVFGGFPVHRLHILFTGETILTNWNFFGYICGISFVFVLNDFIHEKLNGKFTFVLLPLMLLGVIMSTSRSSLLAVSVVSIVLIWKAMRSHEKGKKVGNLLMVAFGSFVVLLCIFQGLKSIFHLDSSFIEKMMARLIDEPIAVFNKHLGYSYDSQALDSMEWRGESSSNALNAFLALNPMEQIFGIGVGGFLERDLGEGLQPHNGVLLILIETGVVGLLLYSLMMLVIARQTIKSKNYSSVFIAIAFIIVYCIGQNDEMTSAIVFLFLGTLMAQNSLELNYNHPEKDFVA